MRTLKSLLIAAALLAASAAHAVVIDFEDLSGQGSLPANYAGLTWGSGWAHYGWAQDPFNPSSPVQRLYNNQSDDSDWFKFSGDVVFDGAYFAGFNTAQFELYNDGILVFTSGTIGLSNTPTFLNSGYAGLIDEVRLNVANGSFVMDDVTYNETPEPAALLLAGVALAGLGYSRRRA